MRWLCLFLGVADTVRKRVRHEPSSIFIWKPEVNHFLDHCGFFNAVRSLGLFAVSDEFTGIGLKVAPPPRPANKLLWFRPLRQEREALPKYDLLRSERLVQGDLIPQNLRLQRSLLEETIDPNVARDTINCVVELCVNAVVYSRGTVFGMVQVTGKSLSISLVDNGIGLHEGLLRMKDSDDPSFEDGLLWHSWKEFAELPPLQRDLAAILEATCTKPISGEPGIWDVLEFVLLKPAGMGKIHTATATLNFDQDLLAALHQARGKLRDGGAKEHLQSVEAALFNSPRRGSRGQFYPVSNRGTHFDLMFPLERSTPYVGKRR